MDHALKILEAFRDGNSRELRSLSDKIMADGFVRKDSQQVRLAVVAHALSKIAEKDYYKRKKEFWNGFVQSMEDLLPRLAEGERLLDKLEQVIIKLDEHFGRYKNDIIHHSQIKRGSTLYAWGMSLTMAAELVGVPEYELLMQVGRTKIVDEEGLGRPVSKRLKDAEDAL